MAISSGDLALLRDNKGHYLTTYASILVPRDLWAARVNNASIERGAITIAFDGGSGSHFAAIEAVQEVWVGTSAGSNDIGRARIRGITSGDSGVTGTLTVAPNSLVWADNAYLTFKHDYPLKPKFPFIEEDGTFKKDGNIAYTDENLEPKPICIAGNHRAKKLSSGTAVFNVDLTDSYAVAHEATISSYGVSVYPTTGVTIDVTAGEGDITFTVAGQYWVKFSCTDSNGKTQNTYRCYFVEPADLSTTFTNFEISQMSGDWDRGGWECDINVKNQADLDTIPDGALIVIWGDWWFNESNAPITFLPDDDNAVMVGYVRRSQQEQDMETGRATCDFQVTTVESLLRQKYDFSVSLEVVEGTPSKWYEYDKNALTIGTALAHLYEHHSTLLQVADFRGLMDNTIPRAYAEMEDGTLYSMGDSLARDRGTRQHIVCDRGGIIRLADERQLLPDAPRALIPTVASLTKADRSGPITIVNRPENEVAFVHVSGFAWDRTFDDEGKPDAHAICAIAPGEKPSDDGPSLRQVERQTFTGQEHANQIAGRTYASDNNSFPELRTGFHGNYLGVLEPCRAEQWEINLTSLDTPRQIVWTDKKLYLISVTVQFEHTKGRVSCFAIFEPEADGYAGVETDCPTFPDFGGDWDLPDYEDQGGAILTAASVYYLPPSKKLWLQRTAQATSHAYADPFWQVRQDSIASKDAIVFRCGVGYIKRSVNACVDETDVTPTTDPPNGAGDSPAPSVGDVEFFQGEGSVITMGHHVFGARWQNGDGEWRTWIVQTATDGDSWEWLQIGGAGGTVDLGALYIADTDKNDADAPVLLDMGGGRLIAAIAAIQGGGSYGDGHLFLIDYDDGAVLDDDAPTSTLFSSIAACKLTDTTFAVIFVDDDLAGLVSAVYDITGDVLTRKAIATIHIIASGVPDFPTAVSIARFSDTVYVMAYNIDDAGDENGMAILGIYNGTNAISYGTAEVFNSGVTPHLDLVEGDLGVHLYYQSDTLTDLRAALLTAPGSVLTISSSIPVVANSVKFVRAAKVDTDKVVVFYADTADSDKLWARVVTLGSGTAVMGTDYPIKDLTVTAVYAAPTGANSAVVAYRDASGNMAYIYVGVTGHALSVGSEVPFSISGGYPAVISLPNGVATMGYDSSEGDRIKIDLPGGTAFRGLGISIGKALGESAYVTGWSDTGSLVLAVLNLTDLQVVASYHLGAASEADVDDLTRVAYPYAPFALGDEFVYIFGRMNNPAGLGESHVIYSEDSGASYILVEGGWGTDHCGGFLDDYGSVFAVRNISGSSGRLYIGDVNALSFSATLPVSAGVGPWAIAFDWYNSTIYLGINSGKSVMVLRSNRPYVEFADLTYNHQTSDGINAIMVL